MKKLTYILTLLVLSLSAQAQHEFRFTPHGSLLKINLNNVSIEGYDGKEIIFQGEKIASDESDERAKGLVAMSQSGYTDNTGLGISVSEKGNEIIVNIPKRQILSQISIKVPQNLKIQVETYTSNGVYIRNLSMSSQNDIILKNLRNEIEVSVNNENIKLENTTGPMNIKTISGKIEALFSNNVKGPISMLSIQNLVDVTLPKALKLNVDLYSQYGKIYAPQDLNIVRDPVENTDNNALMSSTGAITIHSDTIKTTYGVRGGNQTSVFSNLYNFRSGSGEMIKGKVNGGGSIDIILKSFNKNIYLRQN